MRAEAHLGADELELALLQLHANAAGDTDDAHAKELEVRCLLGLGRYPEAATAATRLVNLAPDWARGHALRSLATEKAGDLQDAVAAQREVVRLGADSSQTVRLGELLIAVGRRREGTETLAVAAESRPGDLSLRERIALLVDHNGSNSDRTAANVLLIASCALGVGIGVVAVLLAIRQFRRRSYSQSVRTAMREWTHRRGHGASTKVWALLTTALFLSVILPLLIFALTSEDAGFILVLPGLACAFGAMWEYQRDLPKSFIRPLVAAPPEDCRCNEPDTVGFGYRAAQTYSKHLLPLAVYPIRGFRTMICRQTGVEWLARSGNGEIVYLVRLPEPPEGVELTSDYNGAYL